MQIKNARGFTLIEILMVLLLIAILSAIAMNAFINFRTEARNAALQSNLAAMRASLAAQYAQMQLRCDTAPGVFPAMASLVANDITDGNSTCTVTMITIASERNFLQGSIPQNPWSSPLVNTIIDCTAGGDCDVGAGNFCDGSATATEAWCYNPTTGQIWADSSDPVREGW